MLRRTVYTAMIAAALLCTALGADISGAWNSPSKLPKAAAARHSNSSQDGEKLAGTYSGMFGKAPLSGTVKGDQVEFTFEVSNVDGKVRYKGTLDGATRMKGEVEYGVLERELLPGRRSKASIWAPARF